MCWKLELERTQPAQKHDLMHTQYTVCYLILYFNLIWVPSQTCFTSVFICEYVKLFFDIIFVLSFISMAMSKQQTQILLNLQNNNEKKRKKNIWLHFIANKKNRKMISESEWKLNEIGEKNENKMKICICDFNFMKINFY